MSIVFRLITLVSGVASAWTLVKTIRKMREETRMSRLTPIVAIGATLLTTLLYLFLTAAAVNWLLVLPLLAVGFLLGLAEGQFTRLYYRSATLVGKRSVGYLVLWGLAYLLTLALAQWGNAGLQAVGVLTMLFGLGMAVGSNYVLLRKQNRLRQAGSA